MNIEETENSQEDLNEQANTDSLGADQGAQFIPPNMTFNRKFRRSLLRKSGYIKLKNKLTYRDWFENVKNNIQNGKQMHASNTEDVIRTFKESMEKRNESLAGYLLSKGYSEETVGDIMEKNMEIQDKIQQKKIRK
jgi:hypothetical protein